MPANKRIAIHSLKYIKCISGSKRGEMILILYPITVSQHMELQMTCDVYVPISSWNEKTLG